MAQFTIYRSTDAGAPVLNGANGSLTGVLNAVLVSGYGSKSPAGWSLAYATSTGQAAYQQGTGNRMYLFVNDAHNLSSVGKEALIGGFESMSAIFAGTNPFPTAAQGVSSTNLIARKSVTNDTTARDWVVAADARTFYCFMLAGDAAGVYSTFSFGDFYSFYSGDAFNTYIIGRDAVAGNFQAAERFPTQSSVTSTQTAHYIPRSYNQTGTSIAFGIHGDRVKGDATYWFGNLQYPNGPDSGIYLSRIWLTETAGNLRGTMRGFWHFLHPVASVNDADTLNGGGDWLTGRTFLVIKKFNAGAESLGIIETSNTVDTN